MKKFKLLFPFLGFLFSKPAVVTKPLYRSIRGAQNRERVEKNYGLKSGLPELDLLNLFEDFNEEVDPFTHLYGTSLPIDLAVLKKLAKRFNGCEYLEIGTWRGESLANVSTVAKHCTSLSLSEKEMREMNYTDQMIKVHRMFSRDLSNVTYLEGNSMHFDFKSLNKKFDLIFVDGDHSYEGVKNDTEKVFELLKNENSIIVWHDYTENYEMIDWEVFAGIMDGTPADKRKNIYHISNTLCAIYIPGHFKTSEKSFPEVPNKKFSLNIRASKL